MKPAVIRGVVAHVKWHHYTAAAVNGYIVTSTPNKGWSVSGTVVLSDAFKMTQRPLAFVAFYKKDGQERAWRWPITSHEITNGRLTASLGAPEK